MAGIVGFQIFMIHFPHGSEGNVLDPILCNLMARLFASSAPPALPATRRFGNPYT